MWKISAAKLFCCIFDFEVPLEDLFVQSELHPKITLLYSNAQECFKKNNVTAETISNEKDEKPESKLKLKQMMLNSSYLEGTPQSFLWLIEHFLGMLPIPLLPHYSNGVHLEWLYLSEQCKKLFQHYHKERRISYDLDYDVTREMSKLPTQHYLLLNLHMIFMREVSFFMNKNKKICRRNATYYTKYFTPSIFIRPFRPGLKQDNEKEYYYIILYMLLRWPFLCEMFRYSNLSKIIELPESITETHSHEDIGKKIFTDDCVKQRQDNISMKNKQNYFKANCCCGIGSNYTCNPSRSKCSLHVFYQNTTSNQSENSMNNRFSALRLSDNEIIEATSDDDLEIELENEKIEKNLSQNAEESFIYDDYDTFEKEEFNQIKNRNFETTIKCSQARRAYSNSEENTITHENNNRLKRKVKNDSLIRPNTNLTEGENYRQRISETKLERKVNHTKNKNEFSKRHKGSKTNLFHSASNPTTQVEHSEIKKEHTVPNQSGNTGCEHKIEESIPENQKPITIDTTLMKRVSKLGWTYTPPKTKSVEKCCSNNISKEEINNEILIADSKSDTSLKKYKSVRSLKSKLSFLSINKKNKKNKHDSSNLKYTKINS
ncbi:hypothetical protein WA026_011991 [Henosepilachna vigintioctopunctata]|uniref:Uncharacterized protein n=1 Tax=Henosepilachna vigintioctopunctata TaxID=420089 RepID=A0AAW1VC96_9CUCU